MNTLSKITRKPILLLGMLCLLFFFPFGSAPAVASGGSIDVSHPPSAKHSTGKKKSKKPVQAENIITKLQALRGKPVTVLSILLKPEDAPENETVKKFYGNSGDVLTADQKLAFVWLLAEYAPDNEHHPEIPLAVALSDAKKRRNSEPLAHAACMALKTGMSPPESEDLKAPRLFTQAEITRAEPGEDLTASFTEWCKQSAGTKTQRLQALAANNNIPLLISPESPATAPVTKKQHHSSVRPAMSWKKMAYMTLVGLYFCSVQMVAAQASSMTDMPMPTPTPMTDMPTPTPMTDMPTPTPMTDMPTTTMDETTAGALYNLAAVPVTLVFALAGALYNMM